MVPRPGIETGSAAYKAAASPQCLRGKWCWFGGSNTAPAVYETAALPTELNQQKLTNGRPRRCASVFQPRRQYEARPISGRFTMPNISGGMGFWAFALLP